MIRRPDGGCDRKYSGPERTAGVGIEVVLLLGGYAIVTLPESDYYIQTENRLSLLKPKNTLLWDFRGESSESVLAACAGRKWWIDSEEILVGVVDSGVDYFHRILEMRMAAVGS